MRYSPRQPTLGRHGRVRIDTREPPRYRCDPVSRAACVGLVLVPTTAPGLVSFVSPARLAASALASLAAVLPLAFTLSTLAPLAPVAPLVPVALAPAAASTLAPAPAPSALPQRHQQH